MHCGDQKLMFLTRNLRKMWEKRSKTLFPPLPITVLLSQNHTTTSDPFLLLPCQCTSFFVFVLFFSFFFTPTMCKSYWKGGKLRGRKESKQRYTAVWVRKISCWGHLSLRFDKVAVWPADKWERSWWTARGPQMSILCDVTEKLESSKQLLRPNYLFLMMFVNLQFTDG